LAGPYLAKAKIHQKWN